MKMYIIASGILILVVLYFIMHKKDNKIYDGSRSTMPHMMGQYYPTKPDGLMAVKQVELINKRHFKKLKDNTNSHNIKFYQTPTELEFSNTQKTLDKEEPFNIISSENIPKPVLKRKIIDTPNLSKNREKEMMTASLTKEPLAPPATA
tara:strand:- start:6 stop:449 length:444 start_codon:yes stop_codon:yes gene_type:complete